MAQAAGEFEISTHDELIAFATNGALCSDPRVAAHKMAQFCAGMGYKRLHFVVQGFYDGIRDLYSQKKRPDDIQVLVLEERLSTLFKKFVSPYFSVLKSSSTDYAMPDDTQKMWDESVRVTNELADKMETDPSAFDAMAVLVVLCMLRPSAELEGLLNDVFAKRPRLRALVAGRIANWATLGFALDKIEANFGKDGKDGKAKRREFPTGTVLKELRKSPNGPEWAWLLANMPADVAAEASKIFADPVVAAFNNAIAGAVVSEAPLVQSIRAAWQRFDRPVTYGPTPCQAAVVGRAAAKHSSLVKKMLKVARHMGCETGLSSEGPFGSALLALVELLLETGQWECSFLSSKEGKDELAGYAECRAPSHIVLCAVESIIFLGPLVPCVGAGKLAELRQLHHQLEEVERKARMAAVSSDTNTTAHRQENRAAFGELTELVCNNNKVLKGTNQKLDRLLERVDAMQAMMSPRTGVAHRPPPPGPM